MHCRVTKISTDIAIIYYAGKQSVTVATSKERPSVSGQAEQIVDNTKDALLLDFKKKIERYHVRDSVQQSIIHHLDNKISLLRTESKHIKASNKLLRELAVIAEDSLKETETIDIRIRILKNLVRAWRENVEVQTRVNETNESLRQQAEVEALSYRLKLEGI